jgi:hypothetical protein
VLILGSLTKEYQYTAFGLCVALPHRSRLSLVVTTGRKEASLLPLTRERRESKAYG